MIKFIFLFFITLTFVIFSLSKIKPEVFLKIKEYSIIYFILITGLSSSLLIATVGGFYLSTVSNTLFSNILNYYFESKSNNLNIAKALSYFIFLLPFIIPIAYIYRFKHLKNLIINLYIKLK